MTDPLLITVVDDDESVRESLPDLLTQHGFVARAFASAEAFLASEYISLTECLILDIAMPRMTGPDLQRELARRRQAIPIVFITAHADFSTLVDDGAAQCLLKPFSEAALLDAINAAVRMS
jgi:FixJ family two-component response regulator